MVSGHLDAGRVLRSGSHLETPHAGGTLSGFVRWCSHRSSNCECISSIVHKLEPFSSERVWADRVDGPPLHAPAHGTAIWQALSRPHAMEATCHVRPRTAKADRISDLERAVAIADRLDPICGRRTSWYGRGHPQRR